MFTDPRTPWGPEGSPGGEELGESETTFRPVDWPETVVRLAPRVAAGILLRAQRGDSAFALPAAVIFAGVLLCRGEGGSDVA